MKKVALSFLALFVTAAFAFAEEGDMQAEAPPPPPPAVNTFSGSIISGVRISNTSSGTTFQLYDNNWATPGYEATFNLKSTGSNFGMNIGVALVNGVVTANGATAYVSPMEGLKVEAGTGNSVLGPLDWYGAGTFSGTGLTASYTVSGLTIGSQIRPAITAASATVPVAYGARLDLDKLAAVNVVAVTTNGYTPTTLNATAKLTALEDLGVSLKGGLLLGTMNTTQTVLLNATAGLRIDVINIWLSAVSTNLVVSTADMYVRPEVRVDLSDKFFVAGYYDYHTGSGVAGVFDVYSNLKIDPAFTLKLDGSFTTASVGTLDVMLCYNF